MRPVVVIALLACAPGLVYAEGPGTLVGVGGPRDCVKPMDSLDVALDKQARLDEVLAVLSRLACTRYAADPLLLERSLALPPLERRMNAGILRKKLWAALEANQITLKPETIVRALGKPAPSGPGLGGEDHQRALRCEERHCDLERKLVEAVLSNPAPTLRFVPSIKDGKTNGFTVSGIRPNSIFVKIGFQNGDTIRAINGLEMTTPEKALEVYTALKSDSSASALKVDIERNGELITLDYTIR